MRELTSHKVNGCNESLAIVVQDQPGSGGANHAYNVYGFHTKTNPSADAFNNDETCLKVLFQNGPIKEAGVNGITHEALLAIVEDRLIGFQSGPYACADNAEALAHIRAAMECLQRRTKARVAGGVEGTHGFLGNERGSKRWYFIQTHRDVVFGDEAELRAKVKTAGLAAFAAGGSDHPPLIEDQGPDVLNTVIAAPSELVDASNPQAAEVLAALFVDGVLVERIKALDSRGHAH